MIFIGRSKLLLELTNSDHEIIWAMCEIAGISRRFSCMITASAYYPESAQIRHHLVLFLLVPVFISNNTKTFYWKFQL